MAASLQFTATPLNQLQFHSKTLPKHAAKWGTIRCSAASPTKSYNITLLPGDGIGPEVISVAKNALQLVASLEGFNIGFEEMHVGGAALDAVGVPLPDETLNSAKKSDAILLGAIGGYKWDNNERHLRPEMALLHLRGALKVFANLRPATVLPQLVDASTLKKEIAEGVDLMVVRELTGGIYFGEPRGISTSENGQEIGFNTEVYATYEIERIARLAFETARKRRGKLCSVDKANVLEASMLWRKKVTTLASEYPDVELSHMYVDNAAMQLVRNPKQFDTILTNNIFGDILSDEASMITGSIGMLPSASLGETGPGLFEPIHGSAPDIAGQDKANPLATVLSAAMLLKYGLGEEKAAQRIEAAVLDTLNRGFRTGDIHSAGHAELESHKAVKGIEKFKMSGVSLAVAPRSEPDHETTSSSAKPQQIKERNPQQQAVGVMGSLRVIELQLVAFIMVFSASGLVPLLDLIFPALASAYLLLLSRFAFPSIGRTSTSQEIFQGTKLFRLYMVAGTTVGLFLPLAYVLGGFARGDEHAVHSATPHLFLLSFQILTENIISGLSLFSPPVRALVPLLYTVRRIFVLIDWIQYVWINKTLPANAQFKDVAWYWFGKGLAVANLVYFSINLFGFLIPQFLPRAFEKYFRDRNEIHAKLAEDKQSQAMNRPKHTEDKKAD